MNVCGATLSSLVEQACLETNTDCVMNKVLSDIHSEKKTVEI